MNAFTGWLERITKGSTWIAGVFLIVGLLLLMGNIFGRFMHFVIPGSYELFELIMVIPVACALAYAGLHGSHVVVTLVSARFGPWLAAASRALAALLSFAVWGLIAVAGAQLAYENGLREVTDILGIYYLPFRAVWIFCLALFGLVYFVDFFNALGRFFKK
jgi:TRAP-type C4-dicarboxylate transport system permease small subunit